MNSALLQRDLSQLGSDIRGMVRLIKAVPGFFRERVTLERAKEQIKRELDRREERFLDNVRSQIFERPQSPYLQLLRLAGCEFSDLRAQVKRCGIEDTLTQLAREGVYLSSDELKGKKQVIRGRYSFRVTPGCFESPNVAGGYRTQSSGTTNQPIRSFVSLDLLAIRTPASCLAFAAHDLFSCAHAMYDSILPGSAGINNLMIYARMGVAADRWFARTMPIRSTLERIYHSSTTRLLLHAARYCGAGLPKPEYIRDNQVDELVHWVRAQQAERKCCCITTAASNAARIARTASRLGISLEGTKFIVSGETFTDAKRQIIESAGAKATTRYTYGGSVNIGFGCANPVHTDEIHVNQHLVALIPSPHPAANAGSDVFPLLCTTLDPLFPRLLLNVASGDYGHLTERDCGCALGNAGLSLHLHHIRSFEKFTSEGMNYFYGDLFELFEITLPAEFGGGPGDYQLTEEEDENGQTRLTLVVHPRVKQVDRKKILDRLRAELSKHSRGNRLMADVWANSKTFNVTRAVPYASPRGKILPLHISRVT
jgi:hypothetical protein